MANQIILNKWAASSGGGQEEDDEELLEGQTEEVQEEKKPEIVLTEEEKEKYEQAKAAYLKICEDSWKRKMLPPSASWLTCCEVYGISPFRCYAPKAGYLNCPICGNSRPYAYKPLVEKDICMEFYRHPSKIEETFSVVDNWEPEQSHPKEKVEIKVVLDDVLKITRRGDSKDKERVVSSANATTMAKSKSVTKKRK